MRITTKARLLMGALAAGPIAALLALFLPRYGDAVVSAERNFQAVVAKEVNSEVDRRVGQVYSDATAVAAAISNASATNDETSARAIEAVLATRDTLDVVRLEIPERNVDLVFHKTENDAALAPISTADLRRAVDERGVALLADRSDGIMVVRVAPPSAQRSRAPKAYLTVPVHLAPLQADLERVAKSRGFGDETNVVVTDERRRVVAAIGSWHLGATDDGSALPFFRLLPAGIPADDVGVQADYEDSSGQKMTSSVVTVRSLGWVVGIARPHAVAYANLHRLEQALAVVALLTVFAALLAATLAARAITRPVLSLRDQVRRVGRREWSTLSPPSARRDEIGELDRGVAEMASELQPQEAAIALEIRRRTDLSRFMPQKVVDGIIDGTHRLDLGGKRAELTILFADVVAFTPISESRPPEQIVGLLNELFTVLSEVVFRHDGIVDKFVGDSIMAVWGAPVAQPDHAARALLAAEDMMRFLEAAADDWRARYEVEIRLAIGINSGEAVIGNIGSAKRMDYTAIGDAVNVAARLESIAKPNQVLVSDATARLVGDAFVLRKLGAQRLAGRTTETLVYELEL